MRAISRRIVVGSWVSGSNAGTRARALDVRAGMIHSESPDRTTAFGHPSDFRADTGESGDELLSILLPRPSVDDFFRGAIRESLASANSTARIGCPEANWDLPHGYLVNDGQGGRAAVAFTSGGCVAALCSDECPRDFDDKASVEQAPTELRDDLRSLCQLPFFEWEGRPRLTAVFWGLHESLGGPEPWPTIYNCGAEVLRRELLDEEFWMAESASHNGLSEATTSIIVQIARRAVATRPTTLTKAELAQLVPPGSAHYDEAVDLLLFGGAFRIV